MPTSSRTLTIQAIIGLQPLVRCNSVEVPVDLIPPFLPQSTLEITVVSHTGIETPKDPTPTSVEQEALPFSETLPLAQCGRLSPYFVGEYLGWKLENTRKGYSFQLAQEEDRYRQLSDYTAPGERALVDKKGNHDPFV